MKAIERAIKCFGSQAAMATALGVKQPTISEWLRGDRQVPAERCPVIERETRLRGDAVLCEHIRPDIPWSVLREAAELPAQDRVPDQASSNQVARLPGLPAAAPAAAALRDKQQRVVDRIVYGPTARPSINRSERPSSSRERKG